VQNGRRKKKCRGWVEPVAGHGWKRCEGLAVTGNAVSGNEGGRREGLAGLGLAS
jgi:hypothetical protein